jgi:nucleoside-diphosphate-sugar epimerase
LIGRHLVPLLRETGREVFPVSSADGDVAEPQTWRNYPRADVVIHLAGKTFVPTSWKDPAAFMRCNVMGTVGILDYCVHHGARLVFISSYLYGDPETLPIPETAPLVANNPYALSKKLAEEAVTFYAANMGVKTTVLRPFNVYGPGQSERFLIPATIRQVRGGDRVLVNDLHPRRDYIYVADIVRAIGAAADHARDFSVFNIGSGVSHSVEQVVRIVQQVMQTDLPVVSTGDRRRDEITDTVADITRARQELGWSPEWSLIDGVRVMVEQSATPARINS